jgi:thioredoxin
MFWKKEKKQIDSVAVSDADFDALVSSSQLPVLVDFWAPWCGPCRMISPILEELAMEYKDRVVIAKVNVDQNPGLNQYFKIKSIPTLIFVKNGQLIERISQLVPKPNLQEMLDDLIALEVPAVDREEE